jgi:hypothetical protein
MSSHHAPRVHRREQRENHRPRSAARWRKDGSEIDRQQIGARSPHSSLLTQIVDALARVASAPPLHLVGTVAGTTEIADTAALHGEELLRNGLTVGQVVNGYGDVCQVVTELADEANVTISAQEFHAFNKCLDQAIAGAVTAYGGQRERDLAYEGTEHRGVLAHEMRNVLNTMTLSLAIIREGKVGLGGSTGAMLARVCLGSAPWSTVRLPKFGWRLESPSFNVSRWSSSWRKCKSVVRCMPRDMAFTSRCIPSIVT